MTAPVLQLRVALTAKDYDALVAFYRDGLGLESGPMWTTEGERAQIYDMGTATLEIFDDAAAAMVDNIEVGRRVSGQVRLAIQVPDVDAALERLLAKGAKLVHEPMITPWRDKNARVESPDGLQVTLFQALGPE